MPQSTAKPPPCRHGSAHPPPSDLSTCAFARGIYTRIGSAFLTFHQATQTLKTAKSVSNLVRKHTSLLSFLQQEGAYTNAQHTHASQTCISLIEIARSLTQLLDNLVKQSWWPKKGQMFIQLSTQANSLRNSPVKGTDNACQPCVVKEIKETSTFLRVLLTPLLKDLVFVLSRARRDVWAWSTRENVLRAEEMGLGQAESGLKAVRPGRCLRGRERGVIVEIAEEERRERAEAERRTHGVKWV